MKNGVVLSWHVWKTYLVCVLEHCVQMFRWWRYEAAQKVDRHDRKHVHGNSEGVWWWICRSEKGIWRICWCHGPSHSQGIHSIPIPVKCWGCSINRAFNVFDMKKHSLKLRMNVLMKTLKLRGINIFSRNLKDSQITLISNIVKHFIQSATWVHRVKAHWCSLFLKYCLQQFSSTHSLQKYNLYFCISIFVQWTLFKVSIYICRSADMKGKDISLKISHLISLQLMSTSRKELKSYLMHMACHSRKAASRYEVIFSQMMFSLLCIALQHWLKSEHMFTTCSLPKAMWVMSLIGTSYCIN